MMSFKPHIAIQVKNYETAISFFENVLKMNLIKYTKKESHFQFHTINFYLENNPECKTFFEFYTPAIFETIKELAAIGCEIIETQTPEGDISFLIYTPFGFNFHLLSKK